MLFFLLLSLFRAFSSAEVICNSQVPYNLIPELASCDYAIRRLELQNQQCGSRNMIFSPSAKGAFVVNVPKVFLGAGASYMPTRSVWCAILVLWQPRPTARPPPFDEDVFPFSKVLSAAQGIRNRCLVGRPGDLPQIGRSWIAPNQLVDVQFGGVFGSEGVDGDYIGFASRQDMIVFTADGTNLTIASTDLDEAPSCGDLIPLDRGNQSMSQ